MWGQTGRTPFLYAAEPNDKLVSVPSVPRFSLGFLSDGGRCVCDGAHWLSVMKNIWAIKTAPHAVGKPTSRKSRDVGHPPFVVREKCATRRLIVEYPGEIGCAEPGPIRSTSRESRSHHPPARLPSAQ